MFKKVLFAGAFALAGSLGTTSSAAPIDLGFIMDRSGSIPDADYTLAMNSLAAALTANLPTSGTDVYTVTVVTFAGVATTVVSQEVNSVADLTIVTDAITTAGALGTSGSTNYQAAFDALVAASSPGVEIGIVNMMTDGNSTTGNTDTDDLRNILQDAGWDSLSFEAVGNSIDTTELLALGFDTGGNGATLIANAAAITNPLDDAFVLELIDFGDDYTDALNAKIQTIVDPSPVPLPGSLPALASGLVLFGFIARRRRKAA